MQCGCRSLKCSLLLVLAFVFSACGRHKTPPPQPPRAVTVATAEARDVPLYLDEIGNCAAFESVTIQPQVSGPIVGIHFKDGQDVRKGDLLFTIDPRPYRAALEKAQATLEEDRAKAAFDRAQLARTEELRKTKVAAPQELDSAQAAAGASEAAVRADEAAVAAAQIDLDYCSITSPIDGRTSKRRVDLGNVVAANSTSLLLIQRQDPIYVNFSIPEGELPRVRKFIEGGTLKVQASLPDDPAKSRVGEFNFLDSGVQSDSGTVGMRAVFDNHDRLFWPGQFVDVRILLDRIPDAVLVPNEALQIGKQGPFVFVVKDDKTVDLRPVTAGQRQGDDVVISKGVKPGETVVVTGQLALAPGSAVAPVPADQKKDAAKPPAS